MTITPDQADRLVAAVKIDGGLVSAVDIAGTPVPEVTETGTGNCVADTSTPQMADLMAVAPDLAHTIAGMRWEYVVEMMYDGEWENIWDHWSTEGEARKEYASLAHANSLGDYRLVRRLVGPVEVIDGE